MVQQLATIEDELRRDDDTVFILIFILSDFYISYLSRLLARSLRRTSNADALRTLRAAKTAHRHRGVKVPMVVSMRAMAKVRAMASIVGQRHWWSGEHLAGNSADCRPHADALGVESHALGSPHARGRG